MNTRKLRTIILCTAGMFLAGGLQAQEIGRPTPSHEANLLEPAPTPDRVIYVPQLPSAEQLTQAAGTQGIQIEHVSADAEEVSISYRLADNTVRTVAYRLLTNASASAAPVPQEAVRPPPPVRVVEYVAPPPPPVVYRYRSYDPFWDDPFYWSRPAPVSVHLGFGWHSGPRYYGGHHGRHRHHRHW